MINDTTIPLDIDKRAYKNPVKTPSANSSGRIKGPLKGSGIIRTGKREIAEYVSAATLLRYTFAVYG